MKFAGGIGLESRRLVAVACVSIVIEYAQIDPCGGQVVLYTDEDYQYDMVTVPSLQGLNKEQAKQTLAEYGLNLTVLGSPDEAGALAQEDQSVEAGRSVPMGTAVEVTFATETVGSQ